MSQQKELEHYIGKRLRERRHKLGLTLSEVAHKLGLSHQQVQKYEQAHSRISFSTLYEISIIYGIPINYFFEGFREYTREKTKFLTKGFISFNPPRSLNILLVEDDPSDELFIRKAIENYLPKPNIICVHDGVQIIEFLRYKAFNKNFPRPDIIFLDLNIPKRNGLSILKEIKRDRNIQDIPVIALTNSIRTQDLIALYKNHASGYIKKCFDFDFFKESLTNTLNYWSRTVILPSAAIENHIP